MSLLDPNWKYVPANETDIRKTFQRIRKELKRNQADASTGSSRPVLPFPPIKSQQR